MKEKILNIIKDNITISHYGYMNGCADLEGRDDAVDELTALMCYREVRAFIRAHPEVKKRWRWCFDYLISDYPGSILVQAIEQVKSEHEPTK